MDPAFREIRDHNHFEEFASDFLRESGFEILDSPGEGPDGGKDLIIAESLKQLRGDVIHYKWLVSCKLRTTGRAVGAEEEQDIIGRLQQHSCNGFMAFYSSRPTQGLQDKLKDMKKTTVAQVHLFDSTIVRGIDIIGELRSKPQLHLVALKHMPGYYTSEIEPRIAGDEFARGEK